MKFTNWIWKTTHSKQIAAFRNQCRIGALLEHEDGDRYEITKCNKKGCWFKATENPEPRGLGDILFNISIAGRPWYGDWHYVARHFEVVNPGDSVEEALKAGSR